MSEDTTPLIEALLEVIDAARLYLPGEIGKDEFIARMLERGVHCRFVSKPCLVAGHDEVGAQARHGV